jgi:hypothetical protein
MPFLKKLERIFGPFAIPGLTLYLIIGQVAAFVAIELGRLDARNFLLVPRWVLEGEVWRLLACLFLPPTASVIFVAFAWWMFYLMGSALESHWGTFRYNLFLLSGYGLTVGVAFLRPDSAVTNVFLAGSVFLAFAYLYPDFELALFFILPVKIKWLALVAWAGYCARLALGEWPERLQVLAATGNFFLFFGHDLWLTARMRGRRMKTQAERFAQAGAARHQCRVCGKTDLTDPNLDFRYCSKCAGDECYCPEHIFQHEHMLSDHARPQK